MRLLLKDSLRARIANVIQYVWTGLSLKTQALYVLVFITRYLDIFTHWVSLYNTFMKLFFIVSSCYIIYLIIIKFRYVYRLVITSSAF